MTKIFIMIRDAKIKKVLCMGEIGLSRERERERRMKDGWVVDRKMD
jgi:hypothetical protein